MLGGRRRGGRGGGQKEVEENEVNASAMRERLRVPGPGCTAGRPWNRGAGTGSAGWLAGWRVGGLAGWRAGSGCGIPRQARRAGVRCTCVFLARRVGLGWRAAVQCLGLCCASGAVAMSKSSKGTSFGAIPLACWVAGAVVIDGCCRRGRGPGDLEWLRLF